MCEPSRALQTSNLKCPFVLSQLSPPLARQGEVKKLPPFDKGGVGGIYPGAVTKNQIPLGPPFSKGEVAVVPWSVVSRQAMLFLESATCTGPSS
jgi:hypothetical protein